MGVIMIYGDRFSGERELARTLATHLGYRLITPEVVTERAVAWGGSREKIGTYSCGASPAARPFPPRDAQAVAIPAGCPRRGDSRWRCGLLWGSSRFVAAG